MIQRCQIYLVYNLETRTTIRSRDVEFHEDKFNHTEELGFKLLQETMNY